jgi:helix-turn-helix protein
MGLPRSTFYDAPAARLDDVEIVGRMRTICDEFEAYGYRRVGAELRHQGVVVNHKKIRRLMREHDLQPKRRPRYVATTDSNHDGPIFPDRARDRIVNGPNQLWVADITYIAIAAGFVYLAAILERLVAPGGGLRDQPIDRRQARARRTQGCHPDARSTRRVRASFRPRIAIRLGGLPPTPRRSRPRRLNEPARQSIR